VSEGYVPEGVAHTVVLPLLGDLPQLGDAVKLRVEVQDILAVEALAALDELEVVLGELADLDDMVFGIAPQLAALIRQHAPRYSIGRSVTHMAQFLPVAAVDLEMGRPELRLDALGRGVLEVDGDDALARSAVPGTGERLPLHYTSMGALTLGAE